MQVKALPKHSLMVNERVCQFYRDNFPTNPDYQNFHAGIDKQEGVFIRPVFSLISHS
jgi:hypothetical protein